MLTAVVMLCVWVLLVFVAQVPSGVVHLLYAAAITLLGRRVLVASPRFVS